MRVNETISNAGSERVARSGHYKKKRAELLRSARQGHMNALEVCAVHSGLVASVFRCFE
ncbi:hypothetical protein DSM19430T_07150 [Desulfovibrio psychrotolerans]|uniref:Uncharacterized protein n=1 Tax=Desulfovibrio psychrotolerans TaxID=415242 RepID=A0A7J0BS28_9BACT|nr:hypothetical protein DSM19430T_07150 [Desulfovibrio psychrotolerans]